MTVSVVELEAIGRAAGLCAVGVAAADPFTDTRHTLEARKAQGLDGGMQFTYRNPARSTDPARTLPGATALVVGAYDYQREPPPRPTGQPSGRVAAYSWEDHYAVLRAGLQQVADRIRGDGYRAISVDHPVGTRGRLPTLSVALRGNQTEQRRAGYGRSSRDGEP